eukprot:gene17205-28828_t
MDAVVASASDKKKKTGFGTRDGKGKGKAKEGGGESDEAGPADDDGGGEIEPASPPKATTPNRRTQRRNRAKAAAGNSPSPKKGGGDGRGEDAGGDGDNNADEGGGAPATKEGPVLNDVPKSGFLVSFAGQIETAFFPFHESLYCKFSLVYGPEWEIVAGLQEGCSQVAKRSDDGRHSFVWNFPIDVTFKSTGPFGWPIVLQVYGVDMLGRDVVRGYGARHLPISPGIHEQDVAMFVPVTSNFIQQALGWIVGKQPEFIDPKFVAQGNGREVTRVQSQGNVTLQLTTVMKDFTRFGFRVGQHGGSGDGD